MSVSRDDVAHIAALARLGLAPERVDALVRELNGILAHMEALRRVETSAAAAGAGQEPMPLAPDEPPAVPLARPRETFAPKTRDGFFLVPRLATHEGTEES